MNERAEVIELNPAAAIERRIAESKQHAREAVGQHKRKPLERLMRRLEQQMKPLSQKDIDARPKDWKGSESTNGRLHRILVLYPNRGRITGL